MLHLQAFKTPVLLPALCFSLLDFPTTLHPFLNVLFLALHLSITLSLPSPHLSVLISHSSINTNFPVSERRFPCILIRMRKMKMPMTIKESSPASVPVCVKEESDSEYGASLCDWDKSLSMCLYICKVMRCVFDTV